MQSEFSQLYCISGFTKTTPKNVDSGQLCVKKACKNGTRNTCRACEKSLKGDAILPYSRRAQPLGTSPIHTA